MKVGDLVRYTIPKNIEDQPVGIVVNSKSDNSKYHHRIRVMWSGDTLPIQATVLSVGGGRITSWVKPKDFEVVSRGQKSEGW
jgi:hypothetical protein